MKTTASCIHNLDLGWQCSPPAASVSLQKIGNAIHAWWSMTGAREDSSWGKKVVIYLEHRRSACTCDLHQQTKSQKEKEWMPQCMQQQPQILFDFFSFLFFLICMAISNAYKNIASLHQLIYKKCWSYLFVQFTNPKWTNIKKVVLPCKEVGGIFDQTKQPSRNLR